MAFATPLKSEINAKLLSYWQSLITAPETMPTRPAYCPIDMPREILPHVFLCQISPDPFEVLIRLQGTYIVERAGQHHSGKTITAETFGTDYRAVKQVYRKVYEEAVPLVTEERVASPDGLYVVMEVLHLPLADGDCKDKVSFVTGSLDIIGGNSKSWMEFRAQQWSVIRSDLLHSVAA
ncbi:PAS domain-containing protein [Pelagibius sp. Alg239-R121]|uniref:PAS domain-containing protein n=1 Tax=Pelagibius sp. Alg239-R121 TaxID=2993448 RepID=UPI0024A79AED|nr:PAS domain-containing protein [Pelagibius sp. Alg239-R121]